LPQSWEEPPPREIRESLAVVFPYFYAVTNVNIGRIGLGARVKNIINTFGLSGSHR